MGKIQIDEAEHARLVEAAGKVDELTTELGTVKDQLAEATKPPEGETKRRRTSHDQVIERLDSQKAEMDRLRARESARDIIAEEMAEAWVATATVQRLTTGLLGDLPLTESGELDETALRDACVEARDQAELEAAETLDAAGFGAPRGLGASTPPAGGEATKYTDQITEAASSAFGLTEAEAKTAAKGR